VRVLRHHKAYLLISAGHPPETLPTCEGIEIDHGSASSGDVERPLRFSETSRVCLCSHPLIRWHPLLVALGRPVSWKRGEGIHAGPGGMSAQRTLTEAPSCAILMPGLGFSWIHWPLLPGRDTCDVTRTGFDRLDANWIRRGGHRGRVPRIINRCKPLPEQGLRGYLKMDGCPTNHGTVIARSAFCDPVLSVQDSAKQSPIHGLEIASLRSH